MPNQTPISTQINIAPSGMTWKNWKLVHGTDGFPTRETMEKYLCNPDRVRDLEECRDLNLQTIKQLEALIQLYEAQMEAVGAGGVEPLRKRNKLHQIAEPAAPVGKPIEDAIDALVMAAFTEGGCSEHRMSEARIQTELRKKELRTLLSTPQPCSRSHPHEEMTPMCELRTEIARLTNALARAEAQLAAAPQAVQAEVDLPDVEDMAHSALQEALSFGLSHDVLHRWMSKVMRQTQEAIAATHPTQQGLEARDEDILTRLAAWCDAQAASDWYGRKASDMVRTFAAQAKQGGE